MKRLEDMTTEELREALQKAEFAARRAKAAYQKAFNSDDGDQEHNAWIAAEDAHELVVDLKAELAKRPDDYPASLPPLSV